MGGKPVRDDWTTVIRPVSRWFDLNLKELWRYRDLIGLFVRRDFISAYKQTILGPLWFLLQPLLTTLVFTVIFGKIAQIPTDGMPPMLFYLAGIVSWNYFSSCMTSTANTFVSNAGIFGKVYFPRLAVPVSVVIVNLASFGIQLLLFLGLVAYFKMRGAPIYPSRQVVLAPLLVVHIAVLGLGVGLIVSSLTAKYRDLAFVVGFGTQLWMFATPIVYPMSQVPREWQWLIALNPMAVVVETFRSAFLGGAAVRLDLLALSAAISLLILCAGVILFNRIERTFMDTV